MPGQFKKEDLRIIKTHKALINAMSMVLGQRNFNQVTVHDLCGEAQISRATFYAHFADKYDLLRYWLSNMRSAIIGEQTDYEEIALCVNSFVEKHHRTMRNLLEDANPETAELLHDFIIFLLNLPQAKGIDGQADARQTVLNKFCAGGVYSYLLWQVKNKFPADLPLMNRHLYEIIHALCVDKMG